MFSRDNLTCAGRRYVSYIKVMGYVRDWSVWIFMLMVARNLEVRVGRKAVTYEITKGSGSCVLVPVSPN